MSSCTYSLMVLVKLVVCMSSYRRLADGIGEFGCLHVLMSNWMVLVKVVVCTRSSLELQSSSASLDPCGQCRVSASLYRRGMGMAVGIFIACFLNIHQNGILTALTWLVPRETAAVSALSVYTIQPCTTSLHAKP